MKNKLRTFFITALALGIPAFLSAAPGGDAKPDSAATPAPDRCGMGARGDWQGPMQHGRGGMSDMQGWRGMRQGMGMPYMGMKGMKNGYWEGADCPVPDAFKTRMEDLRTQIGTLRQQWIDAVAARGDKSIEDLKAGFNTEHADQIAKLMQDGQRLREDLEAVRDGLDLPFIPGAGRKWTGAPQEHAMWAGRPFGYFGMGADEDMAPGKLRGTIDAEMATALNDMKGQITPEALEQLRKDEFSKHREDLATAMKQFRGKGMMSPPAPGMTPELARMRKAMCDLDKLSVRDRREFRQGIRKAMQIEDPVKREAAMDKLVSNLLEEVKSDGPDDSTDAQDESGEAQDGR